MLLWNNYEGLAAGFVDDLGLRDLRSDELSCLRVQTRDA